MLREVGLCMAFSFLGVSTYAQEGYIRIDKPLDKGLVGDTADVKGRVSDPDTKVWIVVRPEKAPRSHYVQPPTNIEKDGTWDGMAHIGVPGQHYGQRFQIRVVADPDNPLEEGDLLSSWPPAELSSEVITVVKSEQADKQRTSIPH